MDPVSVKHERLKSLLQTLEGGALVAFSGGADSALLLHQAASFAPRPVAAATADTPTLPRSELEQARAFAAALDIGHLLLDTGETEDPRFLANDERRCFYCKEALFRAMERAGRELGLRWLLYGAIADDLRDYRPGMEAARAAGARAPLLEAGFTKADVRELSRRLGLPTWDKPQSACLSSRFPTGVPIALEGLRRVEAGEELLKALGFRQCRARLFGEGVRLEVEGEEVARAASPAVRRRLVEGLKALGFRFVTLDLEGFRSGSAGPSLEEGTHGFGGNA
jgi:uncharacterized protein